MREIYSSWNWAWSVDNWSYAEGRRKCDLVNLVDSVT